MHRRVVALHAIQRRLNQQFDDHQGLAGAIMQLSGQVGALLFLGTDHLAGEQLQLGITDAALAELEQHRGGKNQRHAQPPRACNPQQRGVGVAFQVFVELAHGRVHIIEVHAGANHPAPAFQHGHVTQLGGLHLSRGAQPVVDHKATAGASAFQQHADGRLTMGVAQLDQVFANQLGLARVHEVGARHVVEEEIAVRAVVQMGQLLHHLFLDVIVISPLVVQGADGAHGQGHVVPQLLLLDRHDGGAKLQTSAFIETALLRQQRPRNQTQ